MTLWHGTTTGSRLVALARPTALAAPGRSSLSALSPYDRVSPYGMSVSSRHTAFCHPDPTNANGNPNSRRSPA